MEVPHSEEDAYESIASVCSRWNDVITRGSGSSTWFTKHAVRCLHSKCPPSYRDYILSILCIGLTAAPYNCIGNKYIKL